MAMNPVLQDAYWVARSTRDVQLRRENVDAVAKEVLNAFRREKYSTKTWMTHPLHPRVRDEKLLDWVFFVSTLNFSFWSSRDESTRFSVTWRPRSRRRSSVRSSSSEKTPTRSPTRWTGYWSLLACVNRAQSLGIPLTDPAFYSCPARCPDSLLRDVFRGDVGAEQGGEEMPLLEERIRCLRQAGDVLQREFGGRVANLVESAEGSALLLVETVTERFECFRDETVVEGRKVHFWKRAQIFVAELWAAFDQQGFGAFHDIDSLTCFPDYRVPQHLHTLSLISYSARLRARLEAGQELRYGCREEVEIRALTVVAVEELRRAVASRLSTVGGWDGGREGMVVNSVLLDFFIWDEAKRIEREQGRACLPVVPCHRTRSIYY